MPHGGQFDLLYARINDTSKLKIAMLDLAFLSSSLHKIPCGKFQCFGVCLCRGDYADCSGRGLTAPPFTTEVNSVGDRSDVKTSDSNNSDAEDAKASDTKAASDSKAAADTDDNHVAGETDNEVSPDQIRTL